ncbi:hypothetical protein LR48_Vigan09g216500 [Vigna angularis]|uniref:At4g15545-like C-terminal domain-containing protein n=1 Tax=Phaseolus angularis TaxID=3914 RepID=A0A0L9VEN2_PHAAN|nr:hypothetical protein LR48_Vigan09g216500 [Vigna angularis]
MLLLESSASSVDLPDELLQLLPSDPYEQLDVARKITSVALSTRVNALQSESSTLRAELADRERLIEELQAQVDSFDAALSEAADKLARADRDKESLVKENAYLSNSVRKLTRDVSKLESFRRTLMKSLHEDEDTSGGAADLAAKLQSQASITSSSQFGDEDASTPSSRSSSMRLNTFDTSNYIAEDRESDGSRSGASHNVVLASQSSTPRITPPGSPPSKSALASPTRTSSKPVSPRRHAMSFSTSRGMFDDRSSSQTGRTRVDGKEFFRQVRSGGAADLAAKLQSQASITSSSQFGDEDASTPSSRSSSMRLNTFDTSNYIAEDRESDGSRSGASHNVVLASQSSTPRITPPGSPPSKSALASPTRTSSKPVSPRRHAMSFSTSRGMFDDRSSSQTGRTRVDGKEFFRQVRSRLSYEQFGAFLANVKELNSHKQTKEETLQNANEIFGAENKDLYTIFEGLITRKVH